MSAEKNVAVSFLVSQRFKQLLETAAIRERRSQTNMLETLLLSYCEQHGCRTFACSGKQQKAQVAKARRGALSEVRATAQAEKLWSRVA